MSKMIKKILALLMMTVVAGCGGGGGGFSTAPGAFKIGNGAGASFVEGLIALGLSVLSSGGSASLSVSIVDAKGNPIAQNVQVTFSSNCISLGKAMVTSPVTTQSGVATTTYTAQGCGGNDVITASATVFSNGVNHFLSATGIINVLPPVLGSIEFISATPTKIALKGSATVGLPATSVVVFKVKDTGGNPVAGQSVNFTLNTSVGGLSVSPINAVSDSLGQVQTVVAAGTVATAVRVTATLTGTDPAIRTQSNQLTITTGIPDQNSFSLSIKTLNPEVFNVDGVLDAVTIHVGDHFNNPVPDGTAVTFTTEGGQIAGSCTTVNGVCTINWVSSNPRPSNGRVTILATAIGEESFVDANGNGLLDASGETFTDLPEAFRDDNENGTRDATEEFLDFNVNGIYNGPDGKYNGLLCTELARDAGAICDAPRSLHVRNSLTMIMSGSDAVIGSPSAISFPVCSTSAPFTPATTSFVVSVRDLRGQVMPAGTTISVSTTNGTLLGTTSVTVPNTITAQDYTFTISSDATQAAASTGFTCTNTVASGILTITVTTPGGIITTKQVTVND